MNKVNDEFEGEEFGDYNLFSLGGTMNKDELIEGVKKLLPDLWVDDEEKTGDKIAQQIISLVLDAAMGEIEKCIYLSEITKLTVAELEIYNQAIKAINSLK